MADYDISGAFKTIENELIDSMMRNFKRHRAEETKEGYNWTQWQAEQLKSLKEYKKRNAEKFKPQFAEINSKIDDMLRTAKADGNAEQEAKILNAIKNGFKVPKKPSEHSTGEFFKINERKLNALIKSTTDDLKRAETAVLRMSNDKYRKAIFNTQVAMNTGSVTYEQAVDMACKDMLDAGLNCVEYKNGARHTLSDYADMAIKTANKRAYLRGEGEERAKYGLSLVVVNSRQGGCSKCAEYIGKVFIDDVYSGGTQSDGKYPLLSNAIAGGLFHPRCKDSTSTYYEGITTLSPVTAEEMAEMDRREQLEAQQQYAERQAQRFDRRAKYSLDEGNKRIAQTRADEWHDRADLFEEKLKKADNISSETVAKFDKGGIMNFDTERTAVNDVRIIGALDLDKYKCVTEDIITKVVVITEKQIEHIKERHPNDFECFGVFFKDIIENPDYIIEANKPNTALILKEIETEHRKFKTVLRLVTSTDDPKYKNSIITFMKIDEKEWNRILRNKKILYKSE